VVAWVYYGRDAEWDCVVPWVHKGAGFEEN
jgi:hypothetical protein